MSTSRREFLVAGSAALTLTAGRHAHAQPAAPTHRSKIDAMLQRAVDAGDVPGVVAMATDRNSVIYEGAFGKRVLGQPAPMTPDTVAWIASMTKALTATAAMQLVEQGSMPRQPGSCRISPALRC
jgi:methyl acetate hydrolase